MRPKWVGAREANQHFSALLMDVERTGESVVIMRRGRPVARLVPEPSSTSAEQEASAVIDALITKYARPMGGKRTSRDEIYDRGELGRL